MFGEMILGQYVPGRSYIHRLDPRTKMVLSALLVVLVFLVQGWAGYGIFTALVLLSTALARIPAGYLLRGLKPVFLFVIITFVYQLIFVQTGRPLVDLRLFAITDGGLVSACFMCIKLLLVIQVVLLCTLTTSPMDFLEGIDRLLRPLRVIGLNSHEVGLVVSGALRFVPTLMEQAEKVRKAQTARGVVFEQGALGEKIRKTSALLVPLLLNVMRRADDLGMAMEARCYQGGVGRTSRRVLRFGTGDGLAAAVCLSWALALILFKL